MLATLDANVMVALFAFLSAVVTVVVPQMMRRVKRTEKHTAEIKEAIGVKNGNGDAMQMIARSLSQQMEVLKWSEGHDAQDNARFEKLDDRYERLSDAVEGVSNQVTAATNAATTAANAAALAASTAASLAADVARRLEDGKKTG